MSSKSLFDKKSLSQLQTELWERVGKKYGLQRGKEGSQAKHVTAAEHKAEVIVQNAEQRRKKIEEQTKSKQAELDELTRTVDAIIQVAGQPIPKKKKQAADEIEALRKKNVVLEQKLNTLNQDRTSLYNEYTKEKCRADRYEKIVREVAEIKAVLPNEYENLLQEAEKIKAERFERERERNRSRFRGWDHGMEMQQLNNR